MLKLELMTEGQLGMYKKKLLQERNLLLSEIKEHERPVNLGTDIGDRDEEIDKEEAFGNELAMANDLKKRLDEIDVAMSKVYANTYGKCESCGKEVSPEVLDADPASRFCKDCKPRK